MVEHDAPTAESLGEVTAEVATPQAASEEYERQPVPQEKTKGLRSFLGLFASEHVAATELLIGPLFVAAGVTVFDVLVGLLVVNLLAVKKRLTLYYQLERIGRRGIVDIYNMANGILWGYLSGAFVYVSATVIVQSLAWIIQAHFNLKCNTCGQEQPA